jgi:hypothetical protein
MGGGPDFEELLVTLPFPRDEALLARIKDAFPLIRQTTYVQINRRKDAGGDFRDRLRG